MLLWLALACAFASYAALRFVPTPAGWIALIWLGFCVAGAVRPGATARRLVCVNAGFLLGVFAIAEFLLVLRVELHSEGSALDTYYLDDELLGYKVASSHETTMRKTGGGELVYDVTYTTDALGLRVAPPSDVPDGGPCILFFGDSLTFGEGLENDETLPWQVGILTGGRYRVHNFGFHGYGPHQMLAALQSGMAQDRIACVPRYVIYQGAGFHVHRVAGLSTWEKAGPRFAVREDGGAELVGRYDPDRFTLRRWLEPWEPYSRVLAWIRTLHRPLVDDDYALMIAILEQTRREVATRFPSAELIVLWWEQSPEDPIADALEARGFGVQRVGAILPDRVEAPDRYRLHRLDSHPNALANRLIAEYLAERFERPADESPAQALAPEPRDAEPR